MGGVPLVWVSRGGLGFEDQNVRKTRTLPFTRPYRCAAGKKVKKQRKRSAFARPDRLEVHKNLSFIDPVLDKFFSYQGDMSR